MLVGEETLYRFICDVCGESYTEDIEHLGLNGEYINAYLIPNSDLDGMREVHICDDCMSDWCKRAYEEHMQGIRGLYLDLVHTDKYCDDEDDDDAVYTLTDKGRAYLEALQKEGNVR